MDASIVRVLLALQAFHVVFLLLHDWVPLGRLNDIRALRRVDPARKIAIGTLVSAAPFVALLLFTLKDAGMARLPHDLRMWLWIGYGLLFAGELQAWWIPYFFRPQPERAARYRVPVRQYPRHFA